MMGNQLYGKELSVTGERFLPPNSKKPLSKQIGDVEQEE